MANAQIFSITDSEEEQANKFALVSLDRLPLQTQSNIWLIVVTAFALILVGVSAALCVGLFLPEIGNTLVSGDTLLSVLTLAAGFVGGLFTPSPTS